MMSLSVSSKDFVEKYFTNIIKKEQFLDYSIEVISNVSGSDNYVSSTYNVSIEETAKGSKQKKLHFYVKVLPPNANYELFPFHIMFHREIYAYSTVLPKLASLQNDLTMNYSDIFFYTKCSGFNDVTNDYIILKDINKDGFTMTDRISSLDLEHCSLVMKNFAHLHALSFVLKEREALVFQEFADQLREFIWCNSDEKYQNYIKNLLDTTQKLAREYIVNEEHRLKMEKFGVSAYKNMCNFYLKPTKTSVICHGDGWKNNIMFRYQDGVPIEARLIDYQIMRHLSPTIDLLYFIASSLTPKFRNEHYQDLLDIYHGALGDNLKYFSLNVDIIYPKSELMKEMKEYSGYGLINACMLLPLITSEERIELTEMTNESQLKDIFNKQLYSERIQGLVDFYVKNDYI